MEESGDRVGSVSLRREGFLAFLELRAPWRGNALDNVMLSQIEEHARALEAGAEDEGGVRCIVICGAGNRHFSTGYNLKDLLSQVEKPEAPITDLEKHPLERAIGALEDLTIPLIGLIQGHAFGAACELALNCDLRIACEGAVFGMPPARLGILYSLRGMRRLMELVGPAIAREMLLGARPLSAERALSLGLVNAVVAKEDLRTAGLEMASAIAANAPLAVRATKRVMRQALRFGDPVDYAAAEGEARELRDACFRSQDFQAAVKGFLKKERVEFRGR